MWGTAGTMGRAANEKPEREMDSGNDKERLVAELRNLYDLYRRVRMNALYYGRRLDATRKFARLASIVVAAGSATGGVSAVMAVLNKSNENLQFLWLIASLLSAAMATAKPLLGLEKDIERYAKLFAGHTANAFVLGVIVQNVRVERDFTAQHRNEYEKAQSRHGALVKDDDARLNERLRNECHAVVNREVPPETLWMPNS